MANSFESPYATFSNNPIARADILGNTDTTVTSAGGSNALKIDNSANKLEFYGSSTYFINGTQTQVPVSDGELRSYTNPLGTFSANWQVDENGEVAFKGYLNSKGQTEEAVVNEITSSWDYQANYWGGQLLKAYTKDPVAYNLKLTTSLLVMGATAAAEPYVGTEPEGGFNPSVTFSESSEIFGTSTAIVVPNAEAVAINTENEIVLNSRGIPYPQVEVESYGTVPFPEGPYTPNNSEALRTSFTKSYKDQFQKWWTDQGYTWPTAPPGSKINIHHIKPLSKGGTNAFDNLVPLIQPEEHKPFTDCWRSFP